MLIDQKVCRAWRSCVAACPYKKTYFNWQTGKVREVHPLLPAARDGTGPGLLPLLRRTHPLPGCAALRRRSIEEMAKVPTTNWSTPTAR